MIASQATLDPRKLVSATVDPSPRLGDATQPVIARRRFARTSADPERLLHALALPAYPMM